MKIRLYDLCGGNKDLRFSPHCWKAKMAMKHKGLEFETVPTPFTAIGAVHESAGSLPVLEHDGQTIGDSFNIALHLDENFPDRPLLFGHPGVVAAARLVEAWVASAIHPVIFRMIVVDIHDVLDEPDRQFYREGRERRIGQSLEAFQEGVDALADRLSGAFSPMRGVLNHHAYLGGNTPLFSDYVVMGALMWLLTIHGSVPLPDDDPVADWFGRCLDLFDGYAASAVKAA